MAVGKWFSTVGKILYAQLLVSVMVSLGFGAAGGGAYALSALIGCGIALLPNLYFAYKVYLARNSDAQGFVNAFYAGETVKLIITAALFTMALKIPSVDFLILLMAYVAVLSVYWFALYYWRI